ncbi:MAG TPA: FAD-dependent oxidoreductase, partial [Chloroflexota bacterium]|nr:FAD-dependent oxidoreductase [Chloroflexota bacterium]
MEGKDERDVIVVGAGPAGAMTATILAQKGHDVLLLDRAPFPRDKTCGDAVPAGAI